MKGNYNKMQGANSKIKGKDVLAMAFVPIQKWGDFYDPMEALDKGTIFVDLDLPFAAGGDGYVEKK